ncbi:hypothetical protein CARN8_700002 [mine drainage metagenome]|uniref:Uncharacterized protein n=1 Tax=mine drainage metagenome TaxID=410659 RepID=A0A3P3ZRG8_9ZZZZ
MIRLKYWNIISQEHIVFIKKMFKK